MKNEEYLKYVETFLNEYKVNNVSIQPNLIRVDMVPREKYWGTCTFIFTERFITCFGDVRACTWDVTWNAAKQIIIGNCNAKDFSYLTGKLEHLSELKEFVFSDEVMDQIKKELSEDLEGDELNEFNSKWEENSYLLYGVDGYRLNGLDEFFEELNVSDYYEYYHLFEKLPDDYYLAVAMLRCIEDYFKKNADKYREANNEENKD